MPMKVPYTTEEHKVRYNRSYSQEEVDAIKIEAYTVGKHGLGIHKLVDDGVCVGNCDNCDKTVAQCIGKKKCK